MSGFLAIGKYRTPSRRFRLLVPLLLRSPPMFRVSIRPINTNDENLFEFQLSLGDAAHCLVASRSPTTTDRLVAAQGWVNAWD